MALGRNGGSLGALLAGKVALVTGGARGQGRSHALTFAREGADVIVCDIASQVPTVKYPMSSEQDLEETVSMVKKLSRGVVGVKADVSDPDQMRGVVEKGLSEFGHIDIVAVNHGIGDSGVAWGCTQEEWDTMLRHNLTGP